MVFPPVLPFQDRAHAGRILAHLLGAYANRPETLVLALPRGGVPVGAEVARALQAPLDVFLVRKLGAPGHEELALGAISSGGVRVMNDDIVADLGLRSVDIERLVARETLEIIRRERVYRGERRPLPVVDKTILLVDDGLATGATMRAAARAIRALQPAKIVVAVPVAAPPTLRDLAGDADEIICVAEPDPFFAVGYWYQDFTPTTDEQVRSLLAGD